MVPFQAKCAPPIRDSTVQIEEVEEEEEEDVIDEEGLSPLMQERLKRARDNQANMVDGYIVPKKKAKAQPAAKMPAVQQALIMMAEYRESAAKAQEGGSSSSKD